MTQLRIEPIAFARDSHLVSPLFPIHLVLKGHVS